MTNGDMLIGQKIFSISRSRIVLSIPRIVSYVEDDDGNRVDVELLRIHPFNEGDYRLTLNKTCVTMMSRIDDSALQFYAASIMSEYSIPVEDDERRRMAMEDFEELIASEDTVIN